MVLGHLDFDGERAFHAAIEIAVLTEETILVEHASLVLQIRPRSLAKWVHENTGFPFRSCRQSQILL